MKVYNGARLIGTPLPSSVVCIGNFDGLHLGHQALVRETRARAARHGVPAVVYTFDPHPAQVLFPEKCHKSLFSREDLAEQLRRRQVDAVVFEPFSKDFSRLAPEAFVADFLVRWLRPKELVVGEDFSFGNQRAGSVTLLKELGPKYGFTVDLIAKILVGGQPVSSSRLRGCVRDGRMQEAEECLGRPFALTGIVEHGAGRGAGIGFATANLRPKGVVLPKLGVYATAVSVGGHGGAGAPAGTGAGAWLPAVTNVGVAPTFNRSANDAEPIVETHILDQNLDLAGTALTVHFLSYLREERKFAGAAELALQIGKDVVQARSVWAKRGEVGGSRS
jgi:riboflavin kinase / FMN adenylyltransferase